MRHWGQRTSLHRYLHLAAAAETSGALLMACATKSCILCLSEPATYPLFVFPRAPVSLPQNLGRIFYGSNCHRAFRDTCIPIVDRQDQLQIGGDTSDPIHVIFRLIIYNSPSSDHLPLPALAAHPNPEQQICLSRCERNRHNSKEQRRNTSQMRSAPRNLLVQHWHCSFL